MYYNICFKIYQSKEEIVNHEFDKYGLGERVVLELTKSIWNERREIYFDNFFFFTNFSAEIKTREHSSIRNNKDKQKRVTHRDVSIQIKN